MSESDKHRDLLTQLAQALNDRYQVAVITDLQANPGDEIPPLLNGFRPDIYCRASSYCIVGEIKTPYDLDTLHTHSQINAFLKYLECSENGIFALSSTAQMTNRAKTILRLGCRYVGVKNTEILIFDTLDFWKFDLEDCVRWHLI